MTEVPHSHPSSVAKSHIVRIFLRNLLKEIERIEDAEDVVDVDVEARKEKFNLIPGDTLIRLRDQPRECTDQDRGVAI